MFKFDNLVAGFIVLLLFLLGLLLVIAVIGAILFAVQLLLAGNFLSLVAFLFLSTVLFGFLAGVFIVSKEHFSLSSRIMLGE